MGIKSRPEQTSEARHGRGSGARGRLIILACGAGLGVILIALVGARAGGRVGIIFAPATTVPRSQGDTTADLVLGQSDFAHNAPNLVDGFGLWMNLAGGDYNGDVAIDKSVSPNRLWVADTENNRVLGWSSLAAFSSHAPANIVIGQADFTSNSCNEGGVSAASLCAPTGVAVDAAGDLYAADKSNARVLEYDHLFSSGKSAGLGADRVFGQANNFSGEFCNGPGLNANSLCDPSGVAVDAAGNLYVADQGNNRVLEYLTPLAATAVAGSGDTRADRVLGQFNSFTTAECNNLGPGSLSLCEPSGVAVDGAGNVYVADTDNSRVLEYDALAVSTRKNNAHRVFGQGNDLTGDLCNRGDIDAPGAASLCFPTHVAVDGADNLYVSDGQNQRVLEYNDPLTSDTTADRVFGQFGSFSSALCNDTNNGARMPVNPGSLCNPAGLALDGADNLYVADAGNNRVLRYDTPPASGADAGAVLGQVLFTTATANFVDGRGFSLRGFPAGMAIDRSVSPNRVYVVDPGNNRVLAWNSVGAFVTHASANLVFGQSNVFTSQCNQGLATPSAASLCLPTDVVADSEGNAYIADTRNNRVLEYDTPFIKGTTADRVFGQGGSFATRGQNPGGLSASSLNLPTGVAVDGAGNLYVAELGNNRVLIFNSPLTTMTAVKVLGQGGSFTSNACNLGGAASAATLCQPWGLALDASDNLYVADLTNSRVLEYNLPMATNAVADRVFGQDNDFTTTACFKGGISAQSLCYPGRVAVDGAGNLYIADTSANRVLEYDHPLSSDTVADRVFGQLDNFAGHYPYPPSPDSLYRPAGVALDSANNLYISDGAYNRVLEYFNPLAPTPSSTPTPTATATPTATPTGVVTFEATVIGHQGPWSFSDTLNASQWYGINDQLPPTVISAANGISFVPGNTITVTYVSGGVAAGYGFPSFDANGDVRFVLNDLISPPGEGDAGTFSPSFFMPSSDYPIYLVELVGTFADSKGAIVGTPFPLGNGPTVLTIPSGATQLQLGTNDGLFADNGGSWTISISGMANPPIHTPVPTPTPSGLVIFNRTVRGTQGPWSFSATLNAGKHYGVRDQLPPTVISSADGVSFAEGSGITVTYLSGTVSAGANPSETFPFVDANGDVKNPENDYLGTYGCAGTYFPSRFMPASDCPIYLVELVGTFADSEGTIVGTPFPLGDGPTTLTVPSGATQLQLGANDCLFSDNSRLWGITIRGKPR